MHPFITMTPSIKVYIATMRVINYRAPHVLCISLKPYKRDTVHRAVAIMPRKHSLKPANVSTFNSCQSEITMGSIASANIDLMLRLPPRPHHMLEIGCSYEWR